MTTIVVNNNEVLADSQVTSGNTISGYNAKKIRNFGEVIVAGAGRYAHLIAFFDWVEEHLIHEAASQEFPTLAIQPPPALTGEDFLGVVLFRSGQVLLYEGSVSFETQQPVCLGSGGDFALAALRGGCTNVKALEVAIELDPFSGGDICIERFSEEEMNLSEDEGDFCEEGLYADEVEGEDLDEDDSFKVGVYFEEEDEIEENKGEDKNQELAIEILKAYHAGNKDALKGYAMILGVKVGRFASDKKILGLLFDKLNKR